MSTPQNADTKVKGFKGKNVLKGRESDVRYLIYYSEDSKDGEMVIFVDNELDLDWEAHGKICQLIDQTPLRESVSKIISGIAALEPIAHNWPDDLKLTSKRLLGEALASVLREDPEGANDALASARKFVKAKSRQVSRYWTLQACLVTGGLAAMAGIIEVICRTCIIGLIGKTTFLLSLCFWAGCVGALLFVVMRFGTQPRVDSTAEKHLHYLEAVARIVGGGIAGILVGGMVKLGLVLPVFGQTGMETLAMCASAMIAGASERLAAGIVTKVENNETTKKENQNADN